MRWTICYSLMTACLGSVLAYGFHDVKTTKIPSVLDRRLDQAFAMNQADQTPVVRKHKKVSVLDTVQADENPTVEIGATRDEVLAVLGTPAVVNDANDRWTYGLHVIMFKNDRVTGCVSLDDERAASVIEDQLKAVSGKSGAGLKKYSSKSRNFRNPYRSSSAKKYSTSAKYASQASRFNKGSARSAAGSGYAYGSGYGYGTGRGLGSGNNGGNYYMSRSGPRYQPFFHRGTLPRGMGYGGGYGNSFGNTWNNTWGGSNSNTRGYSTYNRTSR